MLTFLPVLNGECGPLEEETTQLLQRLPRAEEEEASTIIRRLGEIGPEARSAMTLLMALAVQDRFSHEVSKALTSMGGEAIDTVRAGLNHEQADVRDWTLSLIPAMMHDAEPLVIDILKRTRDPNEAVRRTALNTLGRLPQQAAQTVPRLASLLASEQRGDAASAADALRDLGPLASDAILALRTAAREHSDPYVRCRSMCALALVDVRGHSAADTIAHSLRDTESCGGSFPISVQAVASGQLAAIAPRAKSAAPALLELFKGRDTHKDALRYEQTSYTLATLNISDAAQLFKRDLDFKRTNLSKLSWFFDDREIPTSYDETCIRVCAASALARLDPNDKAAVAYLQKVLVDDRWSVVAPAGIMGAKLLDPRGLAATGLGLLGRRATPALPSLRQAMYKGRAERTDLAVRSAWAIARVDPKDQSCLDVLRDAPFRNPTLRESPLFREPAETVHTILGDRMKTLAPRMIEAAFVAEPTVRRYYINVLAHAGNAEVLALVRRALKDIAAEEEWLFREDGHLVLAELGVRAEPAFGLLLKQLGSDSHLVRAEAARMLGAMGLDAERVVPRLQALLADHRVLVRVRAAQAIGQFGHFGRTASVRLKSLAKDDYASVRAASAKALIQISTGSKAAGRKE